ncbi:4Fe-4S dicluster domain-containing protein [Shewanella dokdonensis]|uniref:4Fe-4S dicluster domain-containing protein n=1 Tax=Shewanella dokdonensis TaxID=712036 RepID=A0ABX8DH72_9GAMM|nr:4Fe-4S dicluster domain-containing protein [Shewanella dokdonensis]QVK24101.1 4Fe-4S dicluster domain-containing protein [Shewanella dokdonensis]
MALTAAEVRQRTPSDCIRCGQCVRACPMGLMPFQMAAFSRISDFTAAETIGIQHCLGCGACSYVCPSAIPLVQYFLHAKGSLNANRLKAQRAAKAKELNQIRLQRLAEEAAAKQAAKAAKRRERPTRASQPLQELEHD